MPGFIFHPEVALQIKASFEWYEAQGAGLGGDYLAELESAYEAIEQFPSTWPKFKRNFRRFLLRKFPYSVNYRAGASLSSWMRFQDRVAAHTRVCSYDRGGYGHSDASPKALTAVNVTGDLHQLLAVANLAPPYVMVGHSLGGMYVRHFAATYPGQVAGFVLIDPFTEDQSRRYWQIDPDSKDQYDREVARLRDCAVLAKTNFNDDDEARYDCIGSRPDPRFDPTFYAAYVATRSRPEYFEANLSETLNMLSLRPFQMFDVDRSLGNLPLIVLTRTPQAGAAGETEERRALRETRNAILIDLHDDIAAPFKARRKPYD